jgi:DNA-binding NarL/FixJ family response regulator
MQSAFILYENILFARGLEHLLQEKGVSVVATAMQDKKHTLEKIKQAAPDFIIAEVEPNAPKMGLLVDRLLRELPSATVIRVSLDDDSATVYSGRRYTANTADDLLTEVLSSASVMKELTARAAIGRKNESISKV